MKIWLDWSTHARQSVGSMNRPGGAVRLQDKNDDTLDQMSDDPDPSSDPDDSDPSSDPDDSDPSSDPDDSDPSSDPDTDCAVVTRSHDLHPLYEASEHSPSHQFQLANTVVIQPYDTSHWIVCNPQETGQIAVIDAETHALLDTLRTPQTLHDLACMHTRPSAPSLGAFVSTLINLRLVHDLDLPPTPCSAATSAKTLSVWLHVTNACNLRCTYCYVAKTAEHMTSQTAKRAIDAALRSAVRHGYQRLHLKYAGGEALLNPAQVFATHAYALQQTQEHGLELSATLLSNGTIMPVRLIEQLKSQAIRVTISLDGLGWMHDQQRPLRDGQHGSFALVERTLTRLCAQGLRPAITVTVSPHTLAGLPALLVFLVERALPFTLNYVRENDATAPLAQMPFSEQQMIAGMRAAFATLAHHLPRRRIIDGLLDKATLRAPHQVPCGMGQDVLVITQRGGVAKCQMNLAHVVTTIRAADPLQAVRADTRGVQVLEVERKEGCATCIWRSWCAGGCPLVTARTTGRVDRRSPHCGIYLALFPEALRLEALRLLTYEAPLSLC